MAHMNEWAFSFPITHIGKWFVYSLNSDLTGSTFYIGMTNNIVARAAGHAAGHAASRNHVRDHIRRVVDQGGTITINLVAVCDTQQEAMAKEAHAIKNSTVPLVNRVGVPNYGQRRRKYRSGNGMTDPKLVTVKTGYDDMTSPYPHRT